MHCHSLKDARRAMKYELCLEIRNLKCKGLTSEYCLGGDPTQAGGAEHFSRGGVRSQNHQGTENWLEFAKLVSAEITMVILKSTKEKLYKYI